MTLGSMIWIVVFILLYAAFLTWYGGRGKPLSPAETDALLAEMRQRAGKLTQEDDEGYLLKQFRELAKSDDGRAFYMVNLLKFRQKALYPAGSPYGDDPLAANKRYNRAILPLLLKRGGHPVFLSQVQGRFLYFDGAEDWDQVAVVRYRSRRDLLKMAVELAGQGVDSHKWAALEKTQVFPVKPVITLFPVKAIVLLLLLVTALITLLSTIH